MENLEDDPNSGPFFNDSNYCIVCLAYANKSCSNCNKVFYCGRDHQRAHRKEHKPNCFPAIAVHRNGIKSFMVSTRDIAPGEIIFEEQALVTGPTSFYKDGYEGRIIRDTPFLKPICLGCSRVLTGIFQSWEIGCPECSWPLCKLDCDQKHWHSDFECQLFQNLKLTPTQLFNVRNLRFDFEMITVLRMLLYKQKDEEIWTRLLELESQAGNQKDTYNKRLDSSMAIMFLLQVCSLWDICSLESKYPPRKLIHNIYVTLKTNKTLMTDPDELFDVYGKFSKLTHSCASNTYALTYPDTGFHTLRAKIPVKKNTILTEFYDIYSLNSMGINERREELFHNYYFWCQCSRCSDPTEFGTFCSGIRCKAMIKTSRCPGYFLPIINKQHRYPYNQWQCNNCKILKKYEGNLSRIYMKLSNEIKEARTLEEKMQIVIKNSTSVVHDNHCLLMDLRHKTLAYVFDAFYKSKDPVQRKELCKVMKEYCVKILFVADKFFAGQSPERGLLLYLLVKALEMEHATSPLDTAKMNLMDCWKVIKEAKDILSSVPTTHPAYTTFKEIQKKDLILQDSFTKFVAGLSISDDGNFQLEPENLAD